MNKRKVSFEEALAECIQHYVDRGYSVEHSTEYVNRGEAEVFRVYDIIQEEKKRGPQPFVDLRKISAKSEETKNR